MGSLAGLGERHRQAVADGTSTISAVADELGVARQSVWRAFRRRGWPTVPAVPTAPVPPPPSPPPLPVPRIACIIDERQIAELAPAILGNSLALLLARLERTLADPERLGPSGLRQCASALEVTVGIFERLGLRQAGDVSNGVLLIEAMSETEVEQIRARQEAEYAGAFPDHEPENAADSLDDAPGSPGRPLRGALGHDTATAGVYNTGQPQTPSETP